MTLQCRIKETFGKKDSSNVIKEYYMTIFSDHQKYFQIMIKTAIFLSVENEVRKVDNLPIGLSWWQCMSGYESHASTKSVST